MDLDDLDLDISALDGRVALEWLQDDLLLRAVRESRSFAGEALSDVEPIVFDLGISKLALSPSLFDRLVARWAAGSGALVATQLSPPDNRLYNLGLIEIRDNSGDTYYRMGEPTTTTAMCHNVSLAHLGMVVLKLAYPAVLLDSLIRQRFFAVVENIMMQLKRKWLPEFLSHNVLLVRQIAARRLDQLDKED